MEQTNTTAAGRNNTLSGQISWDEMITDCWQNVYSVATITLITAVYFDIWCSIRVHIKNVCGKTNDIFILYYKNIKALLIIPLCLTRYTWRSIRKILNKGK
jgi:hypothetical protein